MIICRWSPPRPRSPTRRATWSRVYTSTTFPSWRWPAPRVSSSNSTGSTWGVSRRDIDLDFSFSNQRRSRWAGPEEVFAYALARFAKDRGEKRPAWIVHLSTNLKVYFRKCAGWLEQDARPID